MKLFVLASVGLALIANSVEATYGGGGGGGCSGGCDSNPCAYSGGCGESAPILDVSGCSGGGCVDSHSSSHSSGGYQTSKKTTTIVKEQRNDEVSLVIGGGGHSRPSVRTHHYVQPQVHHADYVEEQPLIITKKKTIISQPQIRTWVEPVGTIIKKKTTYIQPDVEPVQHHHNYQSHHRSSYVEEPSVDTVITKRKTTYVSKPVHEIRGYTKETYVQPVQPVITRKTTYITSPVVHKQTIYKEPIVIHKQRYVDAEPECSGPCGGSKIVKIIKKTSYTDGGDCGGSGCGGGSGGYGSSGYGSSARLESYSEPETVVHRKVTKIVSGPSYSSGESDGGCYGGNCGGGSYGGSGGSYGGRGGCPGGECGGYGSSGKSKSFAYASASAGGSASSGGYGGNGGGGCKTGCDQWKK